jgi:hypothetical protein
MFPGWNTLAGRAAKSRLTRTEEQRRSLCAQGLPGMRSLLKGLMDPRLLTPADGGPGSRRRHFDTATTFHAFLWQTLDGQASCREAVQQVQLARAAVGSRPLPGSSTSAYCQASGLRRRARGRPGLQRMVGDGHCCQTRCRLRAAPPPKPPRRLPGRPPPGRRRPAPDLVKAAAQSTKRSVPSLTQRRREEPCPIAADSPAMPH